MAFVKKTWLARLGQGLNKFSIDGATPVPIINQPDSVTQQGDALSAGNLNDLEQRIADAFDDVEESKADKSTTDALQSQINQQDARLNQHESRIENLEQKAGDYGTWHYPNDPNHSSDMPNKVPTGKAKYGLVKKIVGKSRAWNQLSNLGQSVTNSITDTRTIVRLYFRLNTSPYTTLYNMDISQAYALSTIQTASFSGSVQLIHSGSTNNISFSDNLFTAISGHKYLLMGNITGFDPTTVGGIVIKDLNVYDLTLIFGAGNEPSTVADALAQLPALGQYNAYDAGSLVDTEVSGVESVGVNIWDEEWELGYIDGTGSEVSSTTRIRSKNYIKVLPNTAYYFKASTIFECLCFYDENKNKIIVKYSADTYYTTASNCHYVRFAFGTNYGTTYKHDVQICLNSYADKTTYHPYKTDTLTLSEPVTLRSAESVADELDVESGEITRNIGSVDLGTLTWTQLRDYGWGILYCSKIPDIHNETEIRVNTNIISSKYATYISNDTNPNDNKYLNCIYQIVQSSTYNIGVCLPSSSSTSDISGYLNYELATSTTESIDPVPDNFLEVEGGGTIDTIQEQSPVIDNCLDVGYLTV